MFGRFCHYPFVRALPGQRRIMTFSPLRRLIRETTFLPKESRTLSCTKSTECFCRTLVFTQFRKVTRAVLSKCTPAFTSTSAFSRLRRVANPEARLIRPCEHTISNWMRERPINPTESWQPGGIVRNRKSREGWSHPPLTHRKWTKGHQQR